MKDSERQNEEFAKAWRELLEIEGRHSGGWGCWAGLLAGITLAILAGRWTGQFVVGCVFFFALPHVMGIGSMILNDRLFLREPRERVAMLLNAHVERQLASSAGSGYVLLSTQPLPQGDRWQVRFSSVTRFSLNRAMINGKPPTLEETAEVINGRLREPQLGELLNAVADVRWTGEVDLPATIRDGLPFSLGVIRMSHKRFCTGNLVEPSAGDQETSKMRLARLLFGLSTIDLRGLGICDKNGNMTIFAVPRRHLPKW